MKQKSHKLTGVLGVVMLAIGAFCAALWPAADTSAIDIDIDTSDYGYGRYDITASGESTDGIPVSDSVTFYYLPAYAELEKDTSENRYYLNLFYSADDGSEDPQGEVASMEIRVYDKNGNEVAFSPMAVSPPTTRVELPFEAYGLEEGSYKIEVYAYNRDGNQIYIPYVFYVDFTPTPIPVPDTGGLFQNTNISKTDYLVTGLIIFGIVAVAGVVCIMRSDRRKSKTGNRRRK